MDIPTIMKDLVAYVATQQEAPKPGQLRLSQIGYCRRRLAHEFHGTTPDPSEERPESIIIKEMGTAIHRHFQELLLDTRPGYLYGPETECSINVDGHLVVGHVDLLSDNDEVVDIKTCSAARFAALRTGKVGKEYVWQLNGYMIATGRNLCRFIFVNRDTGATDELLFRLDEKIKIAIFSLIREIFLSQKPESVVKDYEPAANGNLPWQCNWCPFKSRCYPSLIKVGDRRFKVPSNG